VSRIQTTTRVFVIMHVRESRRPSNSGRLIPMALTEGEVRLRGRGRKPTPTDGMVEPGRRSLLLFPYDDAPSLTEALVDADPRPITLIVPDGSWSQARRVGLREPALAGMQRVALQRGPPSRYRLRHNPDPERISTCEAVARALDIIEGPAARAHLETALTAMVEKVLDSRGRVRSSLR
jgi:DTW domain-containing protein YfiP